MYLDLRGIILSMGSADERRRYIATSSLIGWAIPRMITAWLSNQIEETCKHQINEQIHS